MTNKQIIKAIRAIQLQCNQLIEEIECPQEDGRVSTDINMKVGRCMNTVLQYVNKDFLSTHPRMLHDDLASHAKPALFVTSRQDAIFLCHKVYGISYRNLAFYFNRSASSINNTIRIMKWLYEKDAKTKMKIDGMVQTIAMPTTNIP